MYIRKRGKRFQCLIRFKGARLAKSFRLKQNAERWGHKTIAELDAGTYIDRDKLFDKALKKKIQMFYDSMKWDMPVDIKTSIERFF